MIDDFSRKNTFLKKTTYSLATLTNLPYKLCKKIALNIALKEESDIKRLLQEILVERGKISICSRCNGIKDSAQCTFCHPEFRDQSKLMFVENYTDLELLSRVDEFDGIIYTLGGNLISPMRGYFASDLPVESIRNLVITTSLTEVVFAFDQNLEAETTIVFLKNLITDIAPECNFYRLAKGIPIGADIENIGITAIAEAVKFKQKI